MTVKKDDYGDRIKTYEAAYDTVIINRLPVIVRLDGNGFSKVTSRLPKPCYTFMRVMAEATKRVAEDTTGCVFGYCQSDEATLVLKNDQSLTSQPYFDNRIQKIASITAADMTYHFNDIWNSGIFIDTRDVEFFEKNGKSLKKAIFDVRVFAVPSITEMINVVYWRQLDCIKNAVSMAAYAELTKKVGRKEAIRLLHGTKHIGRKELLQSVCSIDFDIYYDAAFRKGYAVYKEVIIDSATNKVQERKKWRIDDNPTLFAKFPAALIDAYDFTTEEE